ncbi:hypothetical protein C8R45DRAFT_349172 [Mycena sanguinolenta]|nr:hypothetical protein C8R45DRAFT_349172 [Mycena sanguinolenta]
MATRAPSQCDTTARLPRLIRPVVSRRTTRISAMPHPRRSPAATRPPRATHTRTVRIHDAAFLLRIRLHPRPSLLGSFEPGGLVLHRMLRVLPTQGYAPIRERRMQFARTTSSERESDGVRRQECQMHGTDLPVGPCPCLRPIASPTRPARTGRPSHVARDAVRGREHRTDDSPPRRPSPARRQRQHTSQVTPNAEGSREWAPYHLHTSSIFRAGRWRSMYVRGRAPFL